MLNVLLALADWSNDAGECWLRRIEDWAKRAHVSPRTFTTITWKLAAAGYLEIQGRGGAGRVNSYRLTIPEPAEETVPETRQILLGLENARHKTTQLLPGSHAVEEPKRMQNHVKKDADSDKKDATFDKKDATGVPGSHSSVYTGFNRLNTGESTRANARGNASVGDAPSTASPPPPGVIRQLTRNKDPATSSGKSALPMEFLVTPEMEAWARTNCPRVDLATATDEWLDYVRRENIESADWVAEWRHGMRNAARWAAEDSAGSKSASARGPTGARRARGNGYSTGAGQPGVPKVIEGRFKTVVIDLEGK